MPIKTTAQDAALEQIMELIQRKEIFPGARLFETDLEKSLGMSRTPIRGALDQLVVDGILEKKQNQRGSPLRTGWSRFLCQNSQSAK